MKVCCCFPALIDYWYLMDCCFIELIKPCLLFGPSSIRGRCVEVSLSFLGLQMKLHNSWKVLFSGGVEKLIVAPSACSYFKSGSIREKYFLWAIQTLSSLLHHTLTAFFLWRLNILNRSGGNASKIFSRTLFKAPDLWNKISEVSSARLLDFTADWKTFRIKYTQSVLS